MIIGYAEFNARVLNLIRALPEEIGNALQQESQQILDVAKSRCPVDTGALVDSGMLQPQTKVGHEIAQPITFGDPEPYYAIYVHEDLSARHPNGGQAKFLESACLEAAPGMSQRVGTRIAIERIIKG